MSILNLKIFWRSIIICSLFVGLGFGLQTPAIAQTSPQTSPQISQLFNPPNPPNPAPNAADGSIKPYLDQVKSKVTEFKLENGMKFIVLERHQAPVVSFVTYADVGGVDEPEGKTGVAHFLEHLAFKGTTRIGTTNWQAEKVALDKLDQLNLQIRDAIAKGQDPKTLQAEFAKAEIEAAKYVKTSEFDKIINQAGGVGLNATTSTDATLYYYNFPANKLELWFSLESDRFLDPVFREFYQEKAVILEEKRTRVENSPFGKLLNAFQDRAFTRHPYKSPVIGYDEDLLNLTRKDVQEFYEKYYGPSNLTIGIVGDVDPQQVKRLAASYFGRYAVKSDPLPVKAVEPPQTAPRSFTIERESQPMYVEGYHRPAIDHPDDAVYAVINRLMTDGRRSRLYDQLVNKQKIALSVSGLNNFPGNKFPSLIGFFALPAPQVTLEKVEMALRSEITKIQQEPVSPEALERVKRRFKVEVLDSLGFNSYMASALVEGEVKLGSWRKFFEGIDRVDAVTAADIQRVAKATFIETNRTIGKLITKN